MTTTLLFWSSIGRRLIDGGVVCYRQIGLAVSVKIGGDDLGGIVVEVRNRRTGGLGEGAVSVAQQNGHRAVVCVGHRYIG